MTQMPYPPQQGYPPQGQNVGYYPPAPQYAPPMPQQYAPPMPQQYAQPGYPPQGAPQQAPPPAPVVAGTMDDFYSQATGAGGPGISWKDKALGTTYRGVVAGKPTVQQDIDYNTKQPKFQKDGVTPKWVMLIPLKGIETNHQGQVEFPDGEAVYYVRGLAKDELARAMAEAGCSGEPAEGAVFQVTLTQRKPNRVGNPSNIVQISYTPPNGVPHQAQAPVQQEAPAAPAPAGLPLVQQQEQAAPAGLPPLGAPAQQQAPAGLPPLGGQQEQAAPPQWAQPAQAQAQVAQSLPPQPPAGLAPEAQALLQQLGAGQAQPQG